MAGIQSGLPIVLLLSLQTFAQTREAYISASLDAQGRIHLVTTDHRDVFVSAAPFGNRLTRFARPEISRDGAAVAAITTGGNKPFALAVYTGGRARNIKGDSDLPIVKKHFIEDGSRIAFEQEPLHFACRAHYELRSTLTGDLLDSQDLPIPCGSEPPTQGEPAKPWVAELANFRTPD